MNRRQYSIGLARYVAHVHCEATVQEVHWTSPIILLSSNKTTSEMDPAEIRLIR
jgi:hypothetical protein